jgi:hypothetical protein
MTLGVQNDDDSLARPVLAFLARFVNDKHASFVLDSVDLWLTAVL